MKDKRILKVLVPILMVCVVAGIWFVQNQSDMAQEQEELAAASEGRFPLNITSVDLEALSQHKLPIIIDFGADACAPCKNMAPVLVSFNKKMQDKAIIQFVDVWKNPHASIGFPVQAIPTQLFVNADGTPYKPSDKIASKIQFNLYADSKSQEHIFTTHQGGLTEEHMQLILEDMGVK